MYSSRYRTGEARPRPGEGREDINTGRECAAGVLGRVARAIGMTAVAVTVVMTVTMKTGMVLMMMVTDEGWRR